MRSFEKEKSAMLEKSERKNMPSQKPSMHPSKGLIGRLKSEAEMLKRRGLNRRERREHIVAVENTYRQRLLKAKKPLESQEQYLRAGNKAEKLLERLEKEKDPKKRRMIIERLGSIRLFHAKSIRTLWTIAEDRKIALGERIAAIKAIDGMAGTYSTKILLRIVETLPLNDIASIEIFSIVSKKIAAYPLPPIREILTEMRAPKRKVLLLHILANIPSSHAIITLTEIMPFIPLTKPKQSLQITQEMRESMSALLRDRTLLEESRANAKTLLEKMRTEAEKTESQKFDFYSNIFLTGVMASAIETWFKNFGNRIPIAPETGREFIRRLEFNREQLLKLGGAQESRFAIEKINSAIATVAEFFPNR